VTEASSAASSTEAVSSAGWCFERRRPFVPVLLLRRDHHLDRFFDRPASPAVNQEAQLEHVGEQAASERFGAPLPYAYGPNQAVVPYDLPVPAPIGHRGPGTETRELTLPVPAELCHITLIQWVGPGRSQSGLLRKYTIESCASLQWCRCSQPGPVRRILPARDDNCGWNYFARPVLAVSFRLRHRGDALCRYRTGLISNLLQVKSACQTILRLPTVCLFPSDWVAFAARPE